MRLGQFLLLAVLGAAFFLPSQAQSPTVAQTPQRDPQAIAVLTQCVNATGGAQALGAIQDFTGRGTITYFWSPQPGQGPAVVRGRGTGQFRLDASLPEKPQSWTVSNGTGSSKEADGTIKTIPYHNAVHLGSMTFPFPKILAALQDNSSSLIYMGLAEVSGNQAHRIQARKTYKVDPGGVLSNLSRYEFFVDVATSQLVKTFNMAHPARKSTIDYPLAVEFSDYRLVNGVLVPFTVTEIRSDVRYSTLRLTDMVFNSGLRDSDFQL